MMDRNLGATSATPGEVGSLGLLYQWGRKDPFLNSSSVSSATQAVSTGTWSTSSESITAAKAEQNPTTFYTGASNYMPNGSWASTKTVYDPCPAGWRVPDGGGNGIWSKAKGSSTYFSITRESYGPNFGGVFGSAETIWYPASGFLSNDGGVFYYVGRCGDYWASLPDPSNSNNAFCLIYDGNGYVYQSSSSFRSHGMAVRCLQDY